MSIGEQIDTLPAPHFDEAGTTRASSRALLETAISLEVRLSFTETEAIPAAWPRTSALAEELGIAYTTVRKLAEELMLEPREEQSSTGNFLVFPPCSGVVMKEELAWREEYRTLPNRLSLSEIIERLGRSKSWVQPKLNELGFTPIIRGSGRKTAHMYPKEALVTLRTINMAVPLDNGWPTVGHIAEATGNNWRWVKRRLDNSEFMPERRRSALTGHILNYYSPEARTYIEAEAIGRPGAGGDRMTAATMATMLDRSEGWVTTRLSAYADTTELGQADNHKTCPHYPRAVFDALKQKSEELAALPEVGDGESLRAIRGAVGGTEATVRARLESLGITTDRRRNKAGRAGNYYPGGTTERLKQHSG